MSKRNDFLELYLSLPEFNEIKFYILGIMLTINLFIPGMLILYSDAQGLPSIPNKNLMIITLVFFNLLSLLFFIFVKKLAFMFYLYTAITFSSFSVFCLCLALKIINTNLEFPLAVIINILIIGIYIFLLFIIKRCIAIKLKSGTVKNPSNERFIKSFTYIGILLAIILKKYLTGNVSSAFIELLASYCFIVSSIGFHKFYLRFKYYKK